MELEMCSFIYGDSKQKSKLWSQVFADVMVLFYILTVKLDLEITIIYIISSSAHYFLD